MDDGEYFTHYYYMLYYIIIINRATFLGTRVRTLSAAEEYMFMCVYIYVKIGGSEQLY